MSGLPLSSTGQDEFAIDPSAPSILGRLQAVDPQSSFRHLALLYEFGCKICTASDVARVSSEALQAIVGLVPLQRCFIALLEKGELQPLACHQIVLGADADSWPVSKTMLLRVTQRNVSLLLRDASIDDDFASVQSVFKHRLKSVMAVPLGTKGNCIGLIYADNLKATNTFTELDLLFLTALSHYIYLGIRNAQELASTSQDLALAQARCLHLQQDLLKRHDMVCTSRPLLHVYERAKQLASIDLPLLLRGETGTGKDLLARLIHAESPRRAKPFVAVNLAAIPETLVDSELFGHERGAFTDAHERRIGKLELAHQGTLFLDEVADIPLPFQAKLLRALESGEFTRVGGNNVIRSDVRLVCATCKDLEQLVDAGEFRKDLYYRLVGEMIEVPPLRERVDDIPALVDFHLKGFGARLSISTEAMQMLQGYPWPGNIRQLRNFIHSLCVIPGAVIGIEDVAVRLQRDRLEKTAFPRLDAMIKRLEREHIQKALTIAAGNKTEASKLLGISKQTMYDRIREFGLDDD